MAKRKASIRETPVLSITLDEGDFNLVKDDRNLAVSGALDHLERDRTEQTEPTGETLEEMRKLLPGVIARKIAQMVPDGFELSKISFKGEISGKLFGIGVGGEVLVDFTKQQ